MIRQSTRLQHLPDRMLSALYDATLGLRVRRSSYARDAELETGTAARDLRILVDRGLLVPHGETRRRFYLASEELRSIRTSAAADRPPVSPPYAGRHGVRSRPG